MSRDALTVGGFLYDKGTVLRDTIKGTFCIK